MEFDIAKTNKTLEKDDTISALIYLWFSEADIPIRGQSASRVERLKSRMNARRVWRTRRTLRDAAKNRRRYPSNASRR